MSKTDKTKPSWVRLQEMGIERDEYSYFDIPRDFRWSNAEKGIGPKHAKWAKRMRSKKNRRREIPHEKIRGYGWGEENYKLNW